MPYYGPGIPNNISVTPVATQVFTPTSGAAATCRITNPGPGTAYIGGVGVTPFNGLPVLPGNRPVQLQNVNASLYACSGVVSVGALGTLAGASTAGSLLFTVATAGVTAGTYIRLGNGSAMEYLSVASVTGAGTPWTATTSTGSLYDHAASCTVATNVVPAGNTLTVSAGVV
jgi:hypothetical protein